MNQIPDIILIDFCEWLKQQLENDHTIDSMAHIIKHENARALERLAKIYLTTSSSNEDDNNYNNSRNTSNINAHTIACYLIELFSKTPDTIPNIYQSETKFMSFLTCMNSDRCIEVDFLEWLIDNVKKPINFDQISDKEFNVLTNKFRLDCHKSDADIQKLISSFRLSNKYVLADKLKKLVPIKTFSKAKDLGYIWGRYYNSNVRFKCLVIPLQKEIETYIEFIEKSRDDLHELTGNYLDIYYSKSDYTHSGFHTLNHLHYLSDNLRTNAPAIIIWEDRIVNAKSINISDLDSNDLFKVIEHLVNDIRNNMDIAEIVEKANIFIRELQTQKLPIFIDNHIEDHSMFKEATLTGNIVAGDNHGNLDYNIVYNQNDRALIEEIEKAKNIIQSFTEINKQQVNALNEILDETLQAIKNNNHDRKDSSKKHFKKAIDLIGVGDKLIAALSSLVNLINFFDFI